MAKRWPFDCPSFGLLVDAETAAPLAEVYTREPEPEYDSPSDAAIIAPSRHRQVPSYSAPSSLTPSPGASRHPTRPPMQWSQTEVHQEPSGVISIGDLIHHMRWMPHASQMPKVQKNIAFTNSRSHPHQLPFRSPKTSAPFTESPHKTPCQFLNGTVRILRLTCTRDAFSHPRILKQPSHTKRWNLSECITASNNHTSRYLLRSGTTVLWAVTSIRSYNPTSFGCRRPRLPRIARTSLRCRWRVR